MGRTRRTTSKGRATRRKKRVFGPKDFNSGDGMLTAVWGPGAWHYLHTVSFNYPVCPTGADKKNYAALIDNLRNTLPCRYCRENVARNLKHNPLRPCHLKDRESYSRYVYQLHETVNKMLGKKSGLTYCDVRERYEHFRARCAVDKPAMLPRAGKKKESGCTEPLYGQKAKCVIKVVPQTEKCKIMTIDNSCRKRRV